MKRITKILAAALAVLLIVMVTSMVTSRVVMSRIVGEVRTDSVKFKMERLTALLETYFIDDYDQQALETAAADGAASAMIAATGDRWSYYISADDMQSHQEQMDNAYVGIGVTIQKVDSGVEIMAVTAGGPAEEAGIQVGDILTAAEDQPLAGQELERVKALVRGEEGTFVSLTLLRGTEEITCSVERRSVVMPVAELTMLDQIAWITIENFDSHCADQTIACIEEALEQGAEALLFDVRFNPGGYKDEMNRILDYLLPEGDLFRSVDYRGVEEVDTSDAQCLSMPMAVLINEDSYSAAEFFAAALQEYDWAEIVGVQTVGKGNFQYTLDLGDGSAVALSSGKYFTPQGKSLTDVGVTPDVVVDLEDADYEALYYGTLEPEKDAQLQAALRILVE